MSEDANESGALPEFPRGKRPQFFADPAVDTLLSMVLELTQEVSVLADRQAAMERFMEASGGFDRAAFEAFEAGAEADGERAAARAALIRRVFRIVRREAGTFDAEEAERFTLGVQDQLSD